MSVEDWYQILIINNNVLFSTYFPNCSPSSIVSGRFFPFVSGKMRANNPPAMERTPKRTNGKGFQKSLKIKINGAEIPPMRPNVEDIPNPTFLKENNI